jgi:hypothetical protein
MNLHYKIVEVWPSDHLIVVRYWTDVLSEEFLASDSNRKEDGTPVRCRSDVSLTLPIPTPTGKELEDLIVRQAPLEWLKTLEKVQAPEIDTSMSDILKLKDTQFTKEDFKILNLNPLETISDDDIQKMIDNLNKEK